MEKDRPRVPGEEDELIAWLEAERWLGMMAPVDARRAAPPVAPAPAQPVEVDGELITSLQAAELQLEALQGRRDDEKIMKRWHDALSAPSPAAQDADDEALARGIAASLEELAVGDLMAADVMEFNDEWCLECHVAFDDHDHTPTWSTCHEQAAAALKASSTPDAAPAWLQRRASGPCIGPCRRCRDASEITACKRCGATGVRFLDDFA